MDPPAVHRHSRLCIPISHSLYVTHPKIVTHPKSFAVFLAIFVLMPVTLFLCLRWMARRWLGADRTPEGAAHPENKKGLAQLSPSIRAYFAVAICLSSAALGLAALHWCWGSASGIAFNVACPWLLSGSWLGGDFSGEALKRFNLPVSRIYQDAKQRKPTKAPPLARVMGCGGLIMVLAGIVGWFA